MGATARMCLASACILLGLAGCGKDGVHLSSVETQLQVEGPIDFGAVIIGQRQGAKVRIRNASAAPVTLRALHAKPPFDGAGLAEPIRIPAGEVREVPVDFAPQDEGPKTQIAALESDADQPTPISLKGFGARVDLVAPQVLDIGAVQVGNTRSATLVLQNTGNLDAQTETLAIDGTDGPLFSTSVPAVPALGRTSVQVVVQGGHLGPIEGALHLRGCKQCSEVVVRLQAHGIAGALDATPNPLAFGVVEVDQSVARTVTVTNIGSYAVHVSQAFLTASSDADFTFTTQALDLNPGDQRQLTVGFAPQSNGRKKGTLRLFSDDTHAPRLDVTLDGTGDGRDTLVSPRSLDFGPVAVGDTLTLPVTITNASSTLSIMLLSAQVSSGARFTGSVAPQLLAPGQQITVPVSYTPTQNGDDSGVFEVRTDERGGTTIDVQLSGKGLVLPPCQWASRPAAVEFESTRVGEIRMLAVALQNTGSDACYLAQIRLSADTDPSFRLSGDPVPSAILYPGDELDMGVVFNPAAKGEFRGTLEFTVSNPGAPTGQVPIHAIAEDGCLVLEPPYIDFGSAAAACAPPTRTIVAKNVCTTPLDIASVTMGAGNSTEFSLTSGNTGPHSLAPGTSETFTVAYQPVNDGPDSQPVVFKLVVGNGSVVALRGVGVMSPTQTDHFVQKDRAKVDQLFVIDNSGSMADKQDALAANFRAFLQQAQAQDIDFHIAVTSTGIDPITTGWTKCPGGANGGEAGHFFPEDNSTPRVLMPTTPGLDAAFANDVHVGICHWLEQGLEAAKRALSQPLVTEVDDPSTAVPNDGNAGFLRDDARLSIIVVSDADDQSDDTVENYESFFKALKGNQPGAFIFSGVVTPDNKAATCPNGEASGDRYIQLAQDTGGVIENVCTSDWAASLARLSLGAFGPTVSFRLSLHPQSASSIQVVVNGQPVTTGWRYDAASNSVVFDNASAPPAGSRIDVTYGVGCGA